jgi:two-component system response regulator NreC
MKTIKLLLVDDHAVVREGLRALLQGAEDMQVIGEAEDGRQAVREAKRSQPDVVLLDLAMPLFNGVEAARQIVLEVPRARILVLSPGSGSARAHARGPGAAPAQTICPYLPVGVLLIE